MRQLDAHLDRPLPKSLPVGGGTCLFISGACAGPAGPSRRLALLVDDAPVRLTASGMPRAVPGKERSGVGGFWGLVPFEAIESARTSVLELSAGVGGGQGVREELGRIELLPDLPAAVEPPSESPRIAICMATFEPPPALLERQIESIRAQTHDDWLCLISDDCSSEPAFRHLRSLVDDDARFSLSRSPTRLGPYRNFERAMSMVPAGARFVALADQDDRWYPEKLAELEAGIGDAVLVYSDMRVVSASGAVTSDTYWVRRRNNHTNLASLLLANTVTGAASLFRRDLLDAALPFPPPLGTAYHDHWLAVVALASGRIAFLDRPLYDYVQHGGAALGHEKASRGGEMRRLLRTRPSKAVAREAIGRTAYSYFSNVCRIALAARALELRESARLTARERRIVRRVARLGDGREPVAWLVARSLRSLVGRNETLDRELTLLAGIAWRRLASASSRRGWPKRLRIEDSSPPREALDRWPAGASDRPI